MTLECAKQKLQQYGQEHLLKYFDTLSETQKEALLQQIEETDFSVLNKIGSNEEESSTGTITPIRALRLQEIHANEDKYRETGLSAIRSAKSVLFYWLAAWVHVSALIIQRECMILASPSQCISLNVLSAI